MQTMYCKSRNTLSQQIILKFLLSITVDMLVTRTRANNFQLNVARCQFNIFADEKTLQQHKFEIVKTSYILLCRRVSSTVIALVLLFLT